MSVCIKLLESLVCEEVRNLLLVIFFRLDSINGCSFLNYSDIYIIRLGLLTSVARVMTLVLVLGI